ncbi:MAG: phospho-sugar mutase [Chlamydiae bacterium]|nr:phospho-sugar mutase [Chlamydiota bacterium]
MKKKIDLEIYEPAHCLNKIYFWLQLPICSKDKKEILSKLQDPHSNLIENFKSSLEFGTSGVRALMGPGPSYLNEVTIFSLSYALGHFINEGDLPKKSCVVGYDGRKNGALFSQVVAQTLSFLGVDVFIITNPVPVPLLAYAVTFYGAACGVMITASHNPKEYNGFKVYSSDGGEITEAQEMSIEHHIRNPEEIFRLYPFKGRDNYIHVVDILRVRDSYFDALKKLSIFSKSSIRKNSDLQIVYSNLHGVGIHLIEEAFSRWGFKNLSLVSAEKEIRADFGKLTQPNPEDVAVFKEGIQFMMDKKADAVIVNDGDADRVGLCIPRKNHQYHIFTGNEMASLCTYYLCYRLKKMGDLPDKSVIYTTFVTTRLIDEIARDFQCYVVRVPTGFKFIAEEMRRSKKGPLVNLLVAIEESFGFLMGEYIKDKDGIAGALFLAEMVEDLKKEQRSCWDLLQSILRKYGYFKERQISWFVTEDKKIKIMDQIRGGKFCFLPLGPLEKIDDFLQDPIYPHNALRFEFKNRTQILVRPSGTESKLRMHISVLDKTDNSSSKLLEDYSGYLKNAFQNLMRELDAS